MSTNALSKAAHDLTRRRHTSVRDRRIASAAGYLGLELAKEAPCYAGAFGAAVLSDSVSSANAIVFVAGTNLSGAGYEYALARLRFVLRMRFPQACVPFDTDPVRRGYLAGHSSRVEPQETRTDNAPAGQRRWGDKARTTSAVGPRSSGAATASQSSAPHPRGLRFGDGPRSGPGFPRRRRPHDPPRRASDPRPRLQPRRFQKLYVPTLLLAGGDSPDPFKASGEALRCRSLTCRVVVKPGQRHAAMDTGRGLFTAAVLNFLQRR